jgi:hypothetical protein
MNMNGQTTITELILTCLLNGYPVHALIARAHYLTHLYSAHYDAKQNNSIVLYETNFEIKHQN